jgi:hypothetical protein
MRLAIDRFVEVARALDRLAKSARALANATPAPMPAVLTLLVAVGVLMGPARPAQAGTWNPRAYADENTIELGVVRDGQPHWFKVWIVVIDDQAYVRLGSASVAKIEANETKPVLKVRVGGQEFDRIKGAPAPEMAERVAQAMAGKYWSDLLVHLVSHPLTLRLVPE